MNFNIPQTKTFNNSSNINTNTTESNDIAEARETLDSQLNIFLLILHESNFFLKFYMKSPKF